jgi:hypothetical protein
VSVENIFPLTTSFRTSTAEASPRSLQPNASSIPSPYPPLSKTYIRETTSKAADQSIKDEAKQGFVGSDIENGVSDVTDQLKAVAAQRRTASNNACNFRYWGTG